MTPSEYNEAAARIMGWEQGHMDGIHYPLWFDANKPEREQKMTCIAVHNWNPYHNIEHAFMLEEWIDRIGGMITYAEELKRIAVADIEILPTSQWLFLMVHATPAQRTIAFVEAFNEN